MLWPSVALQPLLGAAAVVIRVLSAVALLLPSGIGFGHAVHAAEAIASQETYINGMIAEIVQCSRKEGILTIQMRLHNSIEQKIEFSLYRSDYDGFYVTAKSKKYFMLRDAEDTPLARLQNGPIILDQGESWTWWAKYTAPPADIKNINYFTPYTMPFEDLPITD